MINDWRLWLGTGMIVVGAILGGAVDGRAEDSVRATTDQGGGVFTADLTDAGGGVFTWGIASDAFSAFSELTDYASSTIIIHPTNNASPYINDSAAGSVSLIGDATFSPAVDGMAPFFTLANGSSATCAVTSLDTIQITVISNYVPNTYTKAGSAEYRNGKVEAFDESVFWSTNANGLVITNGTGGVLLFSDLVAFSGSNAWTSVSNSWWQFNHENTNNIAASGVAYYKGGAGYTKYDASEQNGTFPFLVTSMSFDPTNTAGGRVADQSGMGVWTSGAGGAAPPRVGSLTNNYMDFDGSADIITSPNNTVIQPDSSDFTWTAWVQFDVTNAYQVLFDCSDGTDRITLQWNNAGNFIAILDSGAVSIQQNITNSLVASTWYNIVWALDRDANATFWMNGSLVDTWSISTASAQCRPASTWWIGERDDTHGGGGLHFNGKMDNYRHFKGVAFSGAQVTNLYNAGLGGNQ